MKILITEPEYFSKESIETFKKIGEVIAERYGRQKILEEVEEVEILVVRIETKVDKEIIDKGKRLKIIGTPTTGTNHIDVDYAKSKGIEVISLPGVNAEATAEHTIALLLALIRKIPWAYESLREGEWKRFKYFGSELNGKTLGLIGIGRIGSRVANFTKSLEMKVIAHDPYVSDQKAKEMGVELVDLRNVLQEADVISIHAVLTEETKHMISDNEFSMMKRNALLINTSRGEIIDDQALLKALSEGKISGAALDVFAKEPLPSDDKLLVYAKSNENLLITPHIAGSTKEAIDNASVLIARKITEAIDKKL